jgi:mannose-6-phosphate isomerase-like protein (cupin superfamily)
VALRESDPVIDGIRSAQVVLPCGSLDETLAFFVDDVGMRVEAIFPADAPTVAIVSGFGVRLRLDSTIRGEPGRLRVMTTTADVPSELVAPNGTLVEIVPADPPVTMPDLVPALVVSRATDGEWGVGRAGMRYRDLIPGRLGGRFIASNIAIPVAGPVADYVHYHRVRFQMIFVRRGWVRVVYEGQGEPFVMHQGDCVLQPPQIRHRVLENSDDFEVVEVSCPADHETFADWETELPSSPLASEHTWFGQRFVHHKAAGASWRPWTSTGFEFRDTGIESATNGLAAVRVARPLDANADSGRREHRGELWFGHILDGALDLHVEERRHRLESGDSFTIPAGMPYRLAACTGDLELLEVSLPG